MRHTIDQVIVFGASGDLAKRKIFPALHRLFTKGVVTQVVGYGRTKFDDVDVFHTHVSSFIQVVHPGFLNMCSYVDGDYTNFGKLKTILDDTGTDFTMNRMFYLSLPPSSYKDVVCLLPLLYSSNGWNRVVMEKPFGHDLASAYDLQEYVGRYVSTEALFMMDHYLAKSSVEYMRTMNFPMAPKRILVMFSENIDVGADRRYFDEVGIVRDVVQNHLLQLVAMACNPREKLAVLKAIPQILTHATTFGQYDGYPFQSRTPTFVKTMCYWNGIPIEIKAGKAMAENFVEIVLMYQDRSRDIHINIQPHGCIKRDGEVILTDNKDDAYVTVLQDVLNNDKTRFTNFEEVEESWRIVGSIVSVPETQPLTVYMRGAHLA